MIADHNRRREALVEQIETRLAIVECLICNDSGFVRDADYVNAVTGESYATMKICACREAKHG